MNFTQAVLIGLGGLTGIVLTLTLVALIRGYVLSVTWGWFIVPVFGAPALTIPQAIGVSLIVAFLTFQSTDCQKQKLTSGERVGEIVAKALSPFLMLGIAWCVKQFL